VGENVWAKGAQELFGQVWGNLGKNPSHPHKFVCSYTYEWMESLKDGYTQIVNIWRFKNSRQNVHKVA